METAGVGMILRGKTISPGVVRGITYLVDTRTLLDSVRQVLPSGTPQEEVERLNAAVGRAGVQLDQLRRQLIGRVSDRGVGIFSAHAGLLHDAKFITQIEHEIRERGLSAEAAVSHVIREISGHFRASRMSLAQDKAADILDIGRRLLKCLSANGAADPELGIGTVVVAPALTPSELVRFAHQGVVGIVTESCGLKSHTAILARGFGIPMLANVKIGGVPFDGGEEIFLDATHGTAILAPSQDEEAAVIEIRDRIPKATGEVRLAPSAPPVTRDGVPIRLLLNISDPSEAASVAQLAAARVGLFRTEFLYMDRFWWPTEEESLEIYRNVAAEVGAGELCIRLVDFGAEKCPPYADIPLNRNPSLGLRGIRLLLQREDILRPQLKALARLATHREVTVLLPMLDTLDTLMAAIETICRVCGCRDRAHLPFRLGTMIEVPSAALMIREIIEHVDEVSIGLNDLTQYLLAADRDDEFVEAYHDPMQPAVLRVVRSLVETASEYAKPVTICGELAGDPRLTGLLLGLGIRRLSVSRSSYPQIVQSVRALSLASIGKSIEKVLKFSSGADVRNFVMQRLAPE